MLVQVGFPNRDSSKYIPTRTYFIYGYVLGVSLGVLCTLNQLSRPPTKIITLDYPNHEHRQRRTSGEIAPKNIEKINFAARRSYYPAICPMDSLDTGGGGPRDANGRALSDTRPTRFGVFLPQNDRKCPTWADGGTAPFVLRWSSDHDLGCSRRAPQWNTAPTASGRPDSIVFKHLKYTSSAQADTGVTLSSI